MNRVRYFGHAGLQRVYNELRRRDPKPGELADGPVARAFAAGRAGRPLASCWEGRYAYAAWAAGTDLSALGETRLEQRQRRRDYAWETQQRRLVAYAGRDD